MNIKYNNVLQDSLKTSRVFIILFLIFCSILNWKINRVEIPEAPTQEHTTNVVMAQAARRIRDKTGLYPCGSGGRAMYDVKMLSLSFFCYEQIDEAKGRELVLISANEFLDVVNQNKDIQPFLSNRPFLPKNIQVMIFIQKPDGSTNNVPNSLRVVSMINGIIDFDVTNADGKMFHTEWQETYEEATEIVNRTKRM